MLKQTVRLNIAVLFAVLLILLAAAGYYLFLHRAPSAPAVSRQAPHTLYKINVDSLQVTLGTVRENQHLSSLLQGYLPGGMIDRIGKQDRDIFDARKIKAGNRYACITSKDSSRRLCYFIYEINLIDFVVVDLTDSLRVYRDKKKVSTLTRTASGTIKTSLWNCFVENRLDLNLGLELSEIFGWTVDFYGLQKGDGFRVVYDELFVDNSPVGIDRIHGAVFRSNGRDYYAIWYDQPGNPGYFDPEGMSLRRSFLKAPLKFSRISSRYTASRKHPILRISRPHYGVDYAAPRGTPVVALGDGKVSVMTWKGGYGRFIEIRHNSNYTTTYAHLSGYAKGIRPGVRVKQGELIGYVGSSGLSTGPHLDFRVYKNGRPTDPLRMESPAAEPVGRSYRELFLKQAQIMKARLDSIR